MKKAIVPLLLSAYLSLHGLVNTTSADSTRNDSQTSKSADRVAAEYLVKKCDEGIEQYVLYLTSQNSLVNISLESTPITTGRDDQALAELSKKENHMLGYHNHPSSVEEYVKYLQQTAQKDPVQTVDKEKKLAAEIAYVRNLPPEIFFTRLMPEAPSAPNDMWAALSKQFIYLAENPNGILEERLLVCLSDKRVRVIGYGLQEDKQRIYSEQLFKYFNAYDAMVIENKVVDKLENDIEFPHEFIGPDCTKYTDVIAKDEKPKHKFLLAADEGSDAHKTFRNSYTELKEKYMREHCQPEQQNHCLEPNFEEFFKLVNDEGTWFLKDLGIIDLKQK